MQELMLTVRAHNRAEMLCAVEGLLEEIKSGWQGHDQGQMDNLATYEVLLGGIDEVCPCPSPEEADEEGGEDDESDEEEESEPPIHRPATIRRDPRMKDLPRKTILRRL